MRHFAEELRERGLDVVERRVASLRGGAGRRARRRLRGAERKRGARRLARLGVRSVPSTQFLTAPEDFAAWADGRKRLVMEDFYRGQRRRLGLLVEPGDKPAGGRWNFDRENRRPPRAGLEAPPPWLPREDAIDDAVRRDLDAMGLEEWGEDAPRAWPATAAEARAALDDFVTHRAAGFGPWQDAMVPGERWLYHSRLSSSFNLWLLDPLEACRAVEAAYRAGDIPIASAEGFVRQVIGWREYVWGMYWLRDWRADDALDAGHAAPRGVLDRRDRRELPAQLRPRRRRDGLRAPHPAADGARRPDAAARRPPVGGGRVVPGPPSSTAPSG